MSEKIDLISFGSPVVVAAWGSAAGEEERRGPLGDKIDVTKPGGDDYFGADSWENAESELQKSALKAALKKYKQQYGDEALSAVFAGDLINQCTVSAQALGGFGYPLLGLYGACSTAAEGMLLASLFTSHTGGSAAAVTSSHNCSAERQFRTPVEYGGQRPPTAQWTATAAGAFIFAYGGDDTRGGNIRVTCGMAGRVVDGGITDANNMGAAMAPAAADTIARYLRILTSEGAELRHIVNERNIILTGDLGAEGVRLLRERLYSVGFDIAASHYDCGLLLYDRKSQDKHAGGSGCGCSAAVMAAHILPRLADGELDSVVFAGTGALMSPMSVAQGLSIPGVAHMVKLVRNEAR